MSHTRLSRLDALGPHLRHFRSLGGHIALAHRGARCHDSKFESTGRTMRLSSQMTRSTGLKLFSTSLLLCASTSSCSSRSERTRNPQDPPSLHTASAHSKSARQPTPLATKPAHSETEPGASATLVTDLKTIAKRFDLSADDLAMLERQGLVVTRSTLEFGRVPELIYDRIYQRDLPVLITSDSILYAFHRQYMDFLEQLEAEQLTSLVERSLTKTRDRLQQATKDGEIDAWTAQELDVYLTVGLRLLRKGVRPVLAKTPGSRVTSILRAIKRERSAKLKLFSKSSKEVDFSHFKPRGHYTHSAKLKRYFRCVMWLSRIPLAIQTFPNRKPTLQRKSFNIAASLSWLVHESGSENEFASYQKILDTFVGPGDDDTPLPIIEFLASQGIHKIRDIRKIPNRAIKQWLSANATQRSQIATHAYFNPSRRPKKPTSRNFMMIGQRFTLDSKVLASLVFDQLVHPNNPGVAIPRKLPKSLDIIAALGNPRAKVHLKEEFARYPYEPALDAATAGLAKLPDKEWTKNLHSAWLSAIASLHKAPDDPRLPANFRSEAWKDKTLQTQLASWAELRHDHILYVKQSLSGSIGCEFPDAYVEPVPHFFAKMNRLIGLQKSAVTLVEREGLEVHDTVHTRLDRFSEVLGRLETIAQKELNHEPLQDAEKHFLKQAVEHETKGYGPVRWDGWYPEIIGEHSRGSFEPTIADVHTDPPDITNGGVAQILHAGTGAFEIATVLVDCPGNKKCVYAGPVSSFYEFIPPKGERLNDRAWQLMLRGHKARETRPTWIKSFRHPDRLSPAEVAEEKRIQRILDNPDRDDF